MGFNILHGYDFHSNWKFSMTAKANYAFRLVEISNLFSEILMELLLV